MNEQTIKNSLENDWCNRAFYQWQFDERKGGYFLFPSIIHPINNVFEYSHNILRVRTMCTKRIFDRDLTFRLWNKIKNQEPNNIPSDERSKWRTKNIRISARSQINKKKDHRINKGHLFRSHHTFVTARIRAYTQFIK